MKILGIYKKALPECHPDHVLIVDGAHLVGHHVAELGELDLARPIRVVLNSNTYFIKTSSFSVYYVARISAEQDKLQYISTHVLYSVHVQLYIAQDGYVKIFLLILRIL
jgi:hypothetical protein